MSYVISFPGEKQRIDTIAIHRSAGACANHAYVEKYGMCKSRDPEWVIGEERHKFWLDAFDARYTSLIINPDQSKTPYE